MGNENCDEGRGIVEGKRVFVGVDKVCKVYKVAGGWTLGQAHETSVMFMAL